MSIERQLRTGGDPRQLADYRVIREELGKLTHPARPEVNWHKVEQLCLNLFQQNGIELQTASWYTQARVQLAGLSGLIEGLAILEALLSHQWSGLWPQAVHARIEILNGLSQRLQQALRCITLEYRDLAQIYQAEKLINSLCEQLQRLELEHLSQLQALSRLLQNAAVRLENSQDTSVSAVVLPPSAEVAATEMPIDQDRRWVYVAQAEPATPRVVIAPPEAKPPFQWKGFVAGVLVTVIVGSGISASIKTFKHSPVNQQLAATLPVLPQPVSSQELAALKIQYAEQLNKAAPTFIASTQRQTEQLARLSPRWALDSGTRLAEQAQALWPTDPAAIALAKSWNQQLNANAAPLDSLNGWHSASIQLQQLADKLNGLDEQRGKYMTVSQLKSSVFAVQQALNAAPPVEESLRKLAAARQQNDQVPPQLVKQLDNQFVQLLSRYVLLAPLNDSSKAN